ncbi:unnamed protein product [Dimorphilus gyrociliatus]|uniref:Rab-GAP TBC domain-containing protein n=1 Tax=Dimorphilus gyrociliatus TaxID=2664684 RepID=A0A7I8WA19_9ANNE|nr:unnamed protein product [Dimorphilus gyrociliatus]
MAYKQSDPALKLKVDLKPFEEGLEDWDVSPEPDNSTGKVASFLQNTGLLETLQSTVFNVSKVFNYNKKQVEDNTSRERRPLTDAEFREYLDSVGNLTRDTEFRMHVYQNGVEHSLRKVVWKHLLNVFPREFNGKKRFDYLTKKKEEYSKIRDEWKRLLDSDNCSENVKLVANMVRKDTLRTDRGHPLFSDDSSENVIRLFNLLVTYALTHPSLSYCQGMSDLASPLLLVLEDEAHAYICFCSLMRRLSQNFDLKGLVLNKKFEHLQLLLRRKDPEFFSYLKYQNADDLLFCYRWVLLELKREFPLDNVLTLLEVMWASIPPDYPNMMLGIRLSDLDYEKSSLYMKQANIKKNVLNTAYKKLKRKKLECQDIDGCRSMVEDVKAEEVVPKLPAPDEFGCENPFLLFLCLALLLQQKDVIIKKRMDYNEIAMHYDKFIRSNDVDSVLERARLEYSAYLREQQNGSKKV